MISNDEIVGKKIYTTVEGLAAASASQTVFQGLPNGETYKLVGIQVSFGTASSSGTLQAEVAGAGVAVGSGVNQLTGTVSLAGTPNTNTPGTVISNPTLIDRNSRVNLILAGTLTSLANCAVTLELERQG